MDMFEMDVNIMDELVCADEGYIVKNPYSARAVRVTDEQDGRYQLIYRDRIVRNVNSEIDAINFLIGG